MTDKTINHFRLKINLALVLIVLLLTAVVGSAFWIFRLKPAVPEIFVETAGLEACESTFSVNCPTAITNTVSSVALSDGATTVNPFTTVTINWTETPAAGYQRYYSLYYKVLDGSSWTDTTYIKTRIAGSTAGSGGSYQWQVPQSLKGKTVRFTLFGYDNKTGDPICMGTAGNSSNISVSTILAVKFNLIVDLEVKDNDTSDEVKVQLKQDGEVKAEETISVGSDGRKDDLQFSVGVGDYKIVVKPKGYLSRAKTVSLSDPAVDVSFDAFLAGDLNEASYNKVNSLDFSIFVVRYKTDDELADFNGDGQVNSLDYSIFVRNYNKTGEE